MKANIYINKYMYRNFIYIYMIGTADTAILRLFHAACTQFYGKLLNEDRKCQTDICDKKDNAAAVQPTYKTWRNEARNETG